MTTLAPPATGLKFRIDRNPLADAVAWTAKTLPQRPSVPVLAGVLLRVADGRLTVSTFDYETSSETTLDVHDGADGAALVSGRLLAEITKALPNKPVDITTAGTHLDIACSSARFTLPTMPVEDYPTLPDMPAAVGTVDAAVFAQAVAQVAVAAGRDDTLPLLTGVLVGLTGDTMTLQGTDRYRLAIRDLPWQPSVPDCDLKALIPGKVLAETAKTLGSLGGDVAIALARDDSPGNGMIGFAASGSHTTSRLLDGEFPQLRTLIPDTHEARAQVSVAALTEVVRRVALVADRATPVRLSFSDTGLVVEAGGSEDARASEAMDATHDGPPMTVAFNHTYLLDGLATLHADTAVLSFTDPRKPVVLGAADENGEPTTGHIHLLMPIRIGG